FSVWSYRTFFADNHTTTDVSFFDTSQQDTYVISSFTSIKDFTEHLNTSNSRSQFLCPHTNDINNVTCISYTSFNTSCCNSTTTSNREYIFDRHKERLINITCWQFNPVINSFHQLKNCINPFWLTVKCTQS